MRFSAALLIFLVLTSIQASELPEDIVHHESRFMAAGICKQRGYQYIDAVGETGQYWLCLHSKLAAPRAVDVREVLARPPQ
jgi:hypothetical protein